MPWQTLDRFRDAAVPKLDNLRRAAAAGLRVPRTWWAAAADATESGQAGPPAGIGDGHLIVRSASPTEDGRTTSNAGQLLSLAVRDRARFQEALRRVVGALPRDERDRPRGAVFVQPFVEAVEAGVVFFDGFYFERTLAAGEVYRGHLARCEPWSDWLRSVYAVFGEEGGGDRRLDIEFARDKHGYILLQVRPALFPIQRNHTLTAANLKETFGDHPSPWLVSTFAKAAHDLSLLARIYPGFSRWEEASAYEVAGRLWVNLSLMLRMMDHVGLPRTYATGAMGGEQGGRADARLHLGRFLRWLPRLVFRGQLLCLYKAWTAERGLKKLDARIESAPGLEGLYRVTVECAALGLNTAMAILGLCANMARVRKWLHVPGSARLVTQQMMEDYSRLTALPDPAEREAGLVAWLARYGHRGPMETDPANPRFAELRAVLLSDLLAARPAPVRTPDLPSPARRFLGWLTRPFFWIDERREWFRDAWMLRCQRLRARLLEEGARLVGAGQLDAPEDVFWLRGSDLAAVVPLREAVAAAKSRAEVLRGIDFPLTATREEIEGLLTEAVTAKAAKSGQRVFPGIPLGPATVEGRALKADSLVGLLRSGATANGLGPDTILVVPALEPSWAVVFPRVAGVVAEVGGELSHASILLREARRPAVVNCAGIFRQVRSGDRLRLDGARGLVELLDAPNRA
jgi:phosphohistidine swiveling domain-containing protein